MKKDNDMKKMIFLILIGVFSFWALIVMNNPFGAIEVLWQFTGIVLIVESVFDIIAITFDTQEVKD